MINIKNKVQLVGPVSNTEVYETKSGLLYSTFQITTEETFFTKEGEEVRQLVKHACISYNKQAVFLRDRVNTGDMMVVEGRLIQLPTKKKSKVQYETVVCINELLRLT